MSHELWRQPAHAILSEHEQQAWAALYGRSHRAEIATTVICELDADPEMKRRHLALYLGCLETQRAHKVRVLRARRIQRRLRAIIHWVVIEPLLGLAQLAQDAGLPVRPSESRPARTPARGRRSSTARPPLEAVDTGTVGAEHPAAHTA